LGPCVRVGRRADSSASEWQGRCLTVRSLGVTKLIRHAAEPQMLQSIGNSTLDPVRIAEPDI